MSMTLTKPLYIKQVSPSSVMSKNRINLKSELQNQTILKSPDGRRKLDYEKCQKKQTTKDQFKIRIRSPKKGQKLNLQQKNGTHSKTQVSEQIQGNQEKSTRTIRKNPSLLTYYTGEQHKKGGDSGEIKETDDHTEFYKYWKSKANQYQQNNFNLLKLNSNLQQQIQKLRSQNQNLKIKLESKSAQTTTRPRQTNSNRIQQHKSPVKNKFQINIFEIKNKQLETQIQKLADTIKRQQQKIEKQNAKIEQLSKVESENLTLKNLLNNMQNRFSEIRSNNDDKNFKKVVIHDLQDCKIDTWNNKKPSRVLNKKISHEIEKIVIDQFIKKQKSARRYTGDNLA